MQLALSCVECIEHRISCCKDHITIKHRTCNVLAIIVVHLDLALLGSETSWHRIPSNICHYNSHLFTEYVCLW